MSDDVTKRINLVYEQTGQDRVLQTLRKLADAEEEVEKAHDRMQRSIDDAARSGKISTEQRDRQTAKLKAFTRSLAENVSITKAMAAEDREAAKAARELAMARKAEGGLGKAQSNASFERDIAGLSQKEQAVRRLARAEQELAQAEKAVTQAKASGDNVALSRAYDAQTKAVNNVAQATKRMNAANSTTAEHLPRLRYALYDVSSTFAIASAAMLAFTGAVLGASITMDRRFADVIRTSGTYMDETGAKTRALRADFDELFSSMPASWGELTQIGTLAGQLGIASENAAEFTRLIVMMTTATDLSVDQAATSMARLATLD